MPLGRRLVAVMFWPRHSADPADQDLVEMNEYGLTVELAHAYSRWHHLELEHPNEVLYKCIYAPVEENPDESG